MGKFKDENGKTRVGMFLKKHGKTVGKGVLRVADNTLLGGLIHNIIEPIIDEDAPQGKVAPKLLLRTIISSTAPALLVLALIFKVITIEQLKELIKLF